MRKILIPTDFSENSKNAMRHAIALFANTPCHFYLLYADVQESAYVERPSYEFGTNILVEKEQLSIEDKLYKLKMYLKSLSKKSGLHKFATIHAKGYFLESVRTQIGEKQIDLIVMGTKGASELKEFFMGTHAGDVITKAECDALVVPDKACYKAFEQIVIPIDFEVGFDDATLRKMSSTLGSQKAQIKLLYVTKSNIPLFKNIEIRQRQLTELLTERLRKPVSFHRVISAKVEDGVKIFTKSVNADLIIMLSKDHGLLQKLFLDTTVEEVSFKTSVPLLSLQA